MLTVTDLSKSFGSVKAVNGVSFHVKKGETFAFLGTNGAGKSTVIHMIINLLRPDKGAVSIADNGKIGVVFQTHRLDEGLTIEDNLLTRAKLYGISHQKAKQKVHTLLAFMQMLEKKHRKYGQCSGGEKRKVDIIRAIIHDPNILILDEPTTGLDAESRVEIWNLLKKLKQQNNLTIFLTTHYIEEAEDADDVVIMHEGHIEVRGTPKQLRKKYSKAILTLHAKDIEELSSFLSNQMYQFEVKNNQIVMEFSHTNETIPLLHTVRDMINDFSVKEPSLEQVFIEITERLKNRVSI